MGQRLRILIAFSTLSAGFGACGPEATDLSVCENVAFKKRLCNTEQYPVSGRCTDWSETDRCWAQCWFDVPCDDLVRQDPSPGVQECLDDCLSSEGRFQCGDGQEVPTSWVCDGRVDCEDASDEETCGGSSTFICDDGASVPASWRCDQRSDCDDGSDETGC